MTDRSSLGSRLRKNWIRCALVFAFVGVLVFIFWPRDLIRTTGIVDRDSVSDITVQVFLGPTPTLEVWSIEDETLIEGLFALLEGQSVRREVFAPRGVRYGTVIQDPGEPWSVEIYVYQNQRHDRTYISIFGARAGEVVQVNGDSYVLYGDGAKLMVDLLRYVQMADDRQRVP